MTHDPDLEPDRVPDSFSFAELMGLGAGPAPADAGPHAAAPPAPPAVPAPAHPGSPPPP
jgi:hypothetical protein